MEENASEGLTRPPEEHDLVALAKEFNRLGVRYVVVGGLAMQRLGFTRATEDIDLLLLREALNETLAKQAMCVLPDKAILELGEERIADWGVVRVNDVITVDLMTEASGLTYEDIRGDIVPVRVGDTDIPFAGKRAMLRMKQGLREKDALDRHFLENLPDTPEAGQNTGFPS